MKNVVILMVMIAAISVADRASSDDNRTVVPTKGTVARDRSIDEGRVYRVQTGRFAGIIIRRDCIIEIADGSGEPGEPELATDKITQGETGQRPPSGGKSLMRLVGRSATLPALISLTDHLAYPLGFPVGGFRWTCCCYHQTCPKIGAGGLHRPSVT